MNGPAPQSGGRSALKTVLIVFGVLTALAILSVGICAVSGAMWMSKELPALQQGSAAATREGQAYAQNHTDVNCMEEGLRRHHECGAGLELACRTGARLFARTCLQHAQPTPTICDGVPPRTDVLRGATWGLGYCADHGYQADQQCGGFTQALIEHCETRVPGQSQRLAPPTTP